VPPPSARIVGRRAPRNGAIAQNWHADPVRVGAPAYYAGPVVQQTLPAAHAPVQEVGAAITRGTVVDRYVVLDVIGEGGMGTVFAAHDASLDRNIALKIVRSEHTDRASQARLVREAKAMARVQHPAIVTVHDVGSIGSRVFIAMELVRGTTLGGWLDAAPRGWRDIVRVFVEAGRGLAAAHAAGVIHRDFKPENVLVDGAGRVRVSDFGLADILASDAESSAPVSAGTPWYMAPEQLTRGAIDARSDEFSFCVALWQAVYGCHPFASTEAELVAAVTSGAVRAAPPGRPAWLAAVLRRGLAVTPADRHPSMTELLAELERPITPRRSRVLVPIAVLGAGLAIGVAVVVSAGGSGPSCEAAAAPADARWHAARRDQIALALGGANAGVVVALDAYVRQWRDQRIDACRATHVRGEQSGELLDLRMQCLDRRLGELDALATALATGEPTVRTNATGATASLVPLSACADVVTLREVVPPPADPRQRARVDRARQDLTGIKVQLDTGRYAQGFAAVEPVAREADAIGYPPLVAEAELLRGSLAWRADHMDLAETALHRAIASAEVGRASDVSARAWLELLWFVSQERGQPAEALRLGALARGAVDRYGGDPLLAARLAERIGVAALDLGKLDDAAPELQRAYELRLRMLGDGDPSVAASLQHLAMLASARGDHATAIERHRRAYAMLVRRLGAEHPHTLLLLNALAAELKLAGQLDESRALLERGLAATERAAGVDTLDAGMYRFNLGIVRAERGEYDEALALERRALAIFGRVRGEDSAEVATCLAELAETLRKAGRHGEAIAEFHLAVPAVEHASGRDSSELADALTGLGRSLIAVNRRREAEPPLRRALEIREHGSDAEATRTTREALATATGRTRAR
jgi:tetratricopeptide (TPR) repeat protein